MTAVFSFKHKGQQSSPQTVTTAADFRVIDFLKEANIVFLHLPRKEGVP